MLPGWTISRMIPYETLIGLATGKYQLSGGVIRWAAGTAKGGQIVRHLIPASLDPLNTIPGLNFIPGIVANMQLGELKDITQFNAHQLMQISGQITNLSQSTQHILGLATGTAVFSGLGLAVSAIGFVAMNHKLNVIDSRLKEIQQDVQAIKNFLESTERARLFSALNALLKIDEHTAPEHCHTMLHTARNTLSEINMRYRELLSEASDIETIMAHEEYFSLTALAQVRCTAELGILDIAYKEMQEMNLFWQSQANRIAQEILLGEYPERFLATDFVDDVPATELIQWMDFVNDDKKGIVWIDELRRKMNEAWYSKGWFSGGGSGLNQNHGVGLEQEQSLLIPAMRKIVARSGVFEGFVAQYELLKVQKMKPSELQKELATLTDSSLVNGYLILEPAKTV